MQIHKLLFVGVMACALSVAWAVSEDGATPLSSDSGAIVPMESDSATTQPSMASEQGKTHKLHLERATKLIGREVRNDREEKLGKLENITVNVPKGHVQYAVLSFGGFLGIGDKYFAIPWSALESRYEQARNEHLLRLNVSKDRLEKAPSFDKNNWPDLSDSQWSSNVDRYWREEAKLSGVRESSTEMSTGQPGSVGRSSETGGSASALGKVDSSLKQMRRLEGDLIRKDVKDAMSKELGNLKDAMIDVPTGQLVYAIIQFSKGAGISIESGKNISDQRYPVPWQAMYLQRDATSRSGDALAMTVSTEHLGNVPYFSEDKWPNMNELAWNNRTFQAYNLKPYWQMEGHAALRPSREEPTG